MYMRSYAETEERMHDLRAIYVNFWTLECRGPKGGNNLYLFVWGVWAFSR
jgi:hypothetical protein